MALLAPGPSTSQASNRKQQQSTIKSKKRARFADENHDSNSIENHQQQSLSSSSLQPGRPTTQEDSHPCRTDYNRLTRSGKFERYDQLLGQFDPLVSPQTTVVDPSPGNVSLTRVQGWLSALTSMVSQLDRGHSHLVEKVLSLPWTVLDDQFVNVYSRFVNGLVSARSEWVQIVLENIVQGFHYSTIPLEHRSALLPSSVNRRVIYFRLHNLLRSILRLVPTLPSTLWPVLDNYFPKKREHLDGHICYLSNLLRIASYCPDLSAKIVQLCIEKCLKIDVEIQVEVEEWEDEEGRLEEEIFGRSIEDAFDRSWADESDLDDDDDDEDNENGDDDDDGGRRLTDEEDEKNVKAPSAQSVRKVKKLAAKLDGMLRCIFDHLQQISVGVAIKPMSTTTNTGTIESVEQSTDDQIITPVIDPQRQFDREVMFDLLLSNFESAILRTRRTRHSNGDYMRAMNSLPVATRVAAISYIASLISRAKYIDKHVTRHVVSLLCARLESGLSTTTTSSSSSEVGNSMSVNQHVVWYAIAQAIFYIFCFRWKDLLVEDDDEEEDDDHLGIRFSHPKKFNDRWLSGLKILERAIFSPLNPLRTCADTVVAQFAKISHETNFIYCYDIIRRNNNHQSNLTTTRTGHCPNVSRSYKEFLSFHEALVSNNPHTIVPPIPFPNTSAPSPADDDRLVASAFQQFFDRLLINRFLRSDDELRIFIESDFGYTPQTKIKKRTITSGTGWLSKPSVGPSVRTLPSSTTQQSIGGGPETVVSIVEEDELSNAKLQFRLLEDRLVDSCRSVEQLSRSRRTLSQALLELSGRLVQFSTTESHGALAEGFRKLSQTLRSISELEGNSAVGYLVTLSDGLSWCSISAKPLKTSSVIGLASYKNIIIVIESALDELDQAKKNEELISIKSNLISNHLRPSLRQHSELLHDDLVYCLLENARTQLIYENQILIELERIKPELDSISLRPSNVIYSSSSGNQPPDHQPHHHTIHHHQQHPNTYQQNSTSTIINSHNIKPTPIRTSQISKKLQVHDRQGQNVDCRQRVDAKSAAASLARLF
ncbi:hypothetical protein H4Q26_007327 [Puccinia striiformis f. sp. tritici PST-130]|nr:hypothetical protein H4Q26_007327 [Puccinia striiformis f. sp. tritici PST-130]